MAALALVGCDILDVENPNNLVEESIQQETAAAAVVNGSLSLAADAISTIWQPYLVASDELEWIGSRDAWLSLDNGFLSDPENEFTDAAFPNLGQARWFADRAVEIVEGHVAENPSDELKTLLARGYLYAGMVYMIIGEVQEDFAFSDKKESGPPVGPANMMTVLDQAVSRLDQAVTLAGEVGEADVRLQALAVRARAKHSRAIWSKIKPTPDTADPLISSDATADAQAVIAEVGAAADWTYTLTYSSATIGNDMAGWVNARKENQFDTDLVTVSAAGDVTGVSLKDPIDDVADPVVRQKLNKWKGGTLTEAGDGYAPLDLVSARMMHLILAEDALANGDEGAFTTHVNHVRAMNGLTAYSGQIPALDLLEHERRVNLMIMGLRLADMYRFGISDSKWQPQSDAKASPGTLLPITIIEIRANCFLNGTC
jgi:hypothetical protein